MGSDQLQMAHSDFGTAQVMSPGYNSLNLNYPLTADLQTWTRKC